MEDHNAWMKADDIWASCRSRFLPLTIVVLGRSHKPCHAKHDRTRGGLQNECTPEVALRKLPKFCITQCCPMSRTYNQSLASVQPTLGQAKHRLDRHVITGTRGRNQPQKVFPRAAESAHICVTQHQRVIHLAFCTLHTNPSQNHQRPFPLPLRSSVAAGLLGAVRAACTPHLSWRGSCVCSASLHAPRVHNSSAATDS